MKERVDIDWREGGKNLEENFEEVENIWYIVQVKNLLSIQTNFFKEEGKSRKSEEAAWYLKGYHISPQML